MGAPDSKLKRTPSNGARRGSVRWEESVLNKKETSRNFPLSYRSFFAAACLIVPIGLDPFPHVYVNGIGNLSVNGRKYRSLWSDCPKTVNSIGNV